MGKKPTYEELEQRVKDLEEEASRCKQAEEVLRQEKNFAESIVETAQAIVLVLDTEGRIVRFNPYMEEISGYKIKEVQGKEWFATFLPKRDHRLIRKLFLQAVGNIQTHGNVNSIITKAGHEIKVEWYDKTLKDAHGNVVGLLAIGLDITKRKQAAKALRESEAQYHGIFDSATDSFLIFDLDGNIVEANPQACKMYGYSYDELIKLSGKDIVHPDYYYLFDQFKRDLRTIGEFQAESLDVRKDGSTFNIESRGTTFDYKGKPHLLAAIRDITKRKQAEEALKESEEKYRTLIETTSEGYWLIDPERKTLDVNESLCDMLGYTREEMIGLSPLHFADEENQKVFKSQMGGIDTTLHRSYEIVLKKKTGEDIHTRFNATTIRDESGSVRWAYALVTDITERIQAEAALWESEKLWRDSFNSLETVMLVVNKDYTISKINDAGLRLLGSTTEAAIGEKCYRLIHGMDRPDEFCPFRKTLETGKQAAAIDRYEKTFDKYFNIRSSPIFNEPGEIVGFVDLLSDVTDRVRIEKELIKTNEGLEQAVARANEMAMQAEVANIAKSQFLANMSHEIRTPMNGVLGFTDMLLDTSLDKNQANYVNTIKESGGILLSLLNDILDLSKIEAGQLDFEEIDFDPEILAYDVCELIHPRLGSKPVELLCHIGDNLPPLVKGDPARFRQVLMNLMGNASKFIESGEIELSLDIEEEKDDRMMLHATIRDTGIGLPEDKLATIFEPFQQADGSTTREYGGTGLGLSICKKLSKLMHGDVWVESPSDCRLKDNIKTRNNRQSHGPGSVFHFVAWLGKAEEKKPRRFTPVSLYDKKVLIVDDNQRNLDILTHVLESVAMRVVALRNPEEVLPTLQEAMEAKDLFDLAILDIQMAGISGYELAEKILDSKYQFRNVPLIALSSLMERDASKCKAVGFDGFLSKPIRREKLYQMLKRLLGEKEDQVAEKVKRVRDKIMTQYSVREEIKHSVRVLLAEDNPVNQKLAKLMLTKAGYQVKVANNGQEAVEKYTTSAEDFDLIFMDIQMPEMDGFEATKAIRKREEQLKAQSSKLKAKDGASSDELSALSFQHSARSERVPIVAMTAHAMKGDREKCLEAGMDDYITKPIKRELMFEIIEKWVLNKEVT